MDKTLTFLIVITAVIRGFSSSSIYEHLYRHVSLQKANSNLPPIPSLDSSHPFMVGLHMGLEDVSRMDAENNQVEISLMVSLAWNSSILWNPSDFHGLKYIPIPRNLIWFPRITILNAMSFYEDLAPQSTLLFNNGLANTLHQYHMNVFCEDVGGKRNSNNVHKCNVSAAISTHGNDLIHLHDPKDMLMPGMELFFNLSRHSAPAYRLQGSRTVKSTFRRAGLPGEKEKIDLEFAFRIPRRRHSFTHT